MTDRQRCLTYNDYLIQEKEGIGLLQERKIFPGYMKDVHLPKEACEQEIEAYRICKCGKVDQDAFLNSYEEYVKKGWLNQLDLDDPKSYSCSLYAKRRDAKRRLQFFTKRNPKAIMAKGTTKGEKGVSAFTREWDDTCHSSHVDYWLYQGQNPFTDFEEVDIRENQ